MNFTPCRDAFMSYHKFSKEEHLPVQIMAAIIFIEGKETIHLQWVESCKHSYDIELHNIGHIPNSGINLISLGHLLQAGAKVTGELNTITVTYVDGDILAPFTTSFLSQNIYTLKTSLSLTSTCYHFSI